MRAAVSCLGLGVSVAWFYKWLARATGPSATSGLHTPSDRVATPSTGRCG